MNRQEAINIVMRNGSSLATFSEELRDDEGVVAAAILSDNFGGKEVLDYASERLKRNPKLLQLVAIAYELQEAKNNILRANISNQKVNEFFRQIRDEKIVILERYFANNREDDWYLDRMVISDYLKDIIDKAVVGTKLNHPEFYMARHLGNEIYTILANFVNNPMLEYDSNLFRRLSSSSKIYGIPLRNNIEDYYREHNSYSILSDFGKNKGIKNVKLPSTVLFSIDLLRLALKNSRLSDDKKDKIVSLLKVIDNYLATDKFVEDTMEDATANLWSLTDLRKAFSQISQSDFIELVENYFSSLDEREVFKNESIVIEEITDTARIVLTNSSGMTLKDSFHAVLLDGKIDIASDKGYKNNFATQDDAVGSVVYDDTHFINIVADGVGGADKGAIGSKILVEELTDWYRALPDYILDDVDAITRSLEIKIAEIDCKLTKQYNYKAQTTLVLAITAGDKTLIVNVGDSTAYSYDEREDKLVELTTLDSKSYGLSYENARHNPYNNVITAAIGCDRRYCLHSKVISNLGQRIILSSDGVTDLIGESNYKKIFKNRVDAQRIVNKAKNNPDTNDFMKSQDNISAIVVDLPDITYGIGRRR